MHNQSFPQHAPPIPPPPPVAPGRGMLKVTGILYIVFGSMSVVMALLAMLGAAVIAEFGEGALGVDLYGATAGFVALISVIMLVQSGFSIFLGIVCIRFAPRIEKGAFLRNMIILHMVFLLMSLVLDPSALTVVSFVVPIIALIGAIRNNKANEYPQY